MAKDCPKICLTALVAVVMSAFCLQLDAEQEHTLLDRATRLVGTSGWVVTFYLWRDNHTLIALLGMDEVPYSTVKEFVLVDTNTGSAQSLVALNRTWKRVLKQNLGAPHETGWRLEWVSLSPDGKWLALAASGEPRTYGSPHYWAVLSLDGSRCLEGQLGAKFLPSEGLIWTLDSQRCYLLLDGAEVGDFDLHTYRMQRRDYSKQLSPLGSLGQPAPHLYALTEDGTKFLALQFTRDNSQQLHVYLITFSGRSGASAPPHQSQVALPEHRDVQAIVLSPNRQWFAWLLEGDHTAGGSSVQELWISRADGSHIRLMGSLPPHSVALQWTPDGKRLSFIYKDALYTVPAE